MKTLKWFILIIFLLIGILAAIYQFGPESIKVHISDQLERWKIKDKVNQFLGKQEPPSDELMVKSESFYMWKDLEGNEHYVTSLKDVPPQFRDQMVKVKTDTMGGKIALLDSKEEAKLLQQMETPPPPEQLKYAEHKIYIYTFKGNQELKETTNYFDKFHMKYEILDVVENPQHAMDLKIKLGLDINKKYSNINFPVIEIDGEIIERVVEKTDPTGNVVSTSLNTAKINKIFGLRSTFE